MEGDGEERAHQRPHHKHLRLARHSPRGLSALCQGDAQVLSGLGALALRQVCQRAVRAGTSLSKLVVCAADARASAGEGQHGGEH